MFLIKKLICKLFGHKYTDFRLRDQSLKEYQQGIIYYDSFCKRCAHRKVICGTDLGYLQWKEESGPRFLETKIV